MHEQQARLIPTLWKYLIKNWVGIFCTALLGIVILLLSTRLEEVARFISLGASAEKIALFIVLQIPYVLQIAIPVSGCLAGFLLFARMSSSGELIAARSVGYSLKELVAPLFIISSIGSLCMFGAMFDIAANCHFAAKKLEHDVRTEEPLALLQGNQSLGGQSYLLDLEGSLRTGSSAKNFIACFTTTEQGRLKIFLADEVFNRKGLLEANNFLALSTEKPKNPQTPGSLLIEQAESKQTPTSHLHEFVEKTHWKINPDHCSLSVVFARTQDLKQAISKALYMDEAVKKEIKELGKFITEPYRRFSLSIGLMTLTMAGAMAGVHIGRHKKRGRFLLPLVLFGVFMACYLAGKNLDNLPIPAILCYLLPHPFLLAAAWELKKQTELGIE